MKRNLTLRLAFALFVVTIIVITVSCPVEWQFQPDDSNFIWAFLAGSGRLIKIDPQDGEVVVNIGGFENIVSMSIEYEDSQLWALDNAERKLHRLNRDGIIEKTIAGFVDPRWVVYSFYDDTVWVADGLGGEVVHLSSDGDIISRIGGFSDVRYLDVDKARGNIWVADFGAGNLVCLTSDGEELLSFAVKSPISPVVETDTGSCWAVDYETGNLFLYQLNGEVLEFEDYNPVCEKPVMMTYDETTQYIWLAEEDGEVLLINQGAYPEITYSDFAEASGVSAVYSDFSCWVADGENNQLVHIDSLGNITAVWGGFFQPKSLAVVNRYSP